jgi:hypothetical protein
VDAICTLTFIQSYRRLLIRDEWLKKVRQFYRDYVTGYLSRVVPVSTTITVENIEMEIVAAAIHGTIVKTRDDVQIPIST